MPFTMLPALRPMQVIQPAYSATCKPMQAVSRTMDFTFHHHRVGRGCMPSRFGMRAHAAASIHPDDGSIRPAKTDTRHVVWSYQQEQVKKMLVFMGPALLIPMADPMMTLVDTVCIGQFAGTTELAAMGPANMVFAFSMYAFQCLQVATLSLVASHLRDGQKKAAAHSLGTALIIALAGGLASASLLLCFSSQIVGMLGINDQALLPLAADYIRVRVLAQPAVLMTMVAQSGMIAQQDSLTPCLAVTLTVSASLIANLIFVAWLGWGLRGAAITTVGTQYLGVAALLWALHRKRSTLIPDWTLPTLTQLLSFLRTCAPLAVVSLSKNTCYLIMSTTAATLPTLYLAAHQAALSIWALFTWTITPVEQACLAYLPAAKRLWQQQALSHVVVVMGLMVAVTAGASVGALLLWAPGLLCKDVAVQPFMSSIAPQAVLSLLLVGIDVSATAMNLALKDFPYVARSYVLTLAAISTYYAVCRSQGWGLGGIWWGLVLFFGIRAVQSISRAAFHLYLEPRRTAVPGEDPMMRAATSAVLDSPVQGSPSKARTSKQAGTEERQVGLAQTEAAGGAGTGSGQEEVESKLQQVRGVVQGSADSSACKSAIPSHGRQQVQGGAVEVVPSHQETQGNGQEHVIAGWQEPVEAPQPSWHHTASEASVLKGVQHTGIAARDVQDPDEIKSEAVLGKSERGPGSQHS